MLNIDDFEQLSPEARKFYHTHREYYDKMADKWGDMVNMVVVIESDTRKGEIEEASADVATAD